MRPLTKSLRFLCLEGVLLQTGGLQDSVPFWLHAATQGPLLLPDQVTAWQDLSLPGFLGPLPVSIQGRWESTAAMLCHPLLLRWVLSVLSPIISHSALLTATVTNSNLQSWLTWLILFHLRQVMMTTQMSLLRGRRHCSYQKIYMGVSIPYVKWQRYSKWSSALKSWCLELPSPPADDLPPASYSNMT